jgi:hypothetical protein
MILFLINSRQKERSIMKIYLYHRQMKKYKYMILKTQYNINESISF